MNFMLAAQLTMCMVSGVRIMLADALASESTGMNVNTRAFVATI